MGNFSRDVLYNLDVEGQESCFLAFDPSDYTEVRQYAQNPAFDSEDISHLLPLANEAVVHLSRTNEEEYAVELALRYSYLSEKDKKKFEKDGRFPLPAFSVSSQQAFKKPRQDFEEIISGFFYDLQSILDKTLTDDYLFIREGYTAQSGNFYTYPNLMAAMALWKVDRAILAIQGGWSEEVARLLVETHQALVIAKMPSVLELHDMNKKKVVSEIKAQSASSGPKKQDAYKHRVIALYKALDNGELWKSRSRAADLIYTRLLKEFKDPPISNDQASVTIEGWLAVEDPERKLIKPKKS